MFNKEQDAINDLVEDEMDDLEYPTAPTILKIWVDSSRSYQSHHKPNTKFNKPVLLISIPLT
jgi:hypothetical protein